MGATFFGFDEDAGFGFGFSGAASTAGAGALPEFCERYGESFPRWWADLGEPKLDPATAAALSEGVNAEGAGASQEELSRRRDALIVAMLNGTKGLR